MDAAEKEKVINKLKKMLELIARDPESNEAKTAAVLAAKIMSSYGLSKEDLNVTAEDGSSNIKAEEVDMQDITTKEWETLLMIYLGETFDVKVIRSSRIIKVGEKETKLWTAGFIGFKQDMELAIWYYKYLRLVIGRKSEGYSRNANQRTSFATGMVHSVGKRFEEMNKAKEEVRTQETKDLVLYKDALLDEVMQRLFPKVKMQKIKQGDDRSAFEHGWKEGKKVGLGRPIAGPGDDSGGSNGPLSIG